MSIPKCPTCGIEYKPDTTAYSPNCKCGMIFTQIFEMKDSDMSEIRLLQKEIEALKAETIEAEKAVADLMELNDRLCEALTNLVNIFPDDPIDGEETVSEVVAAKLLLNHNK